MPTHCCESCQEVYFSSRAVWHHMIGQLLLWLDLQVAQKWKIIIAFTLNSFMALGPMPCASCWVGLIFATSFYTPGESGPLDWRQIVSDFGFLTTFISINVVYGFLFLRSMFHVDLKWKHRHVILKHSIYHKRHFPQCLSLLWGTKKDGSSCWLYKKMTEAPSFKKRANVVKNVHSGV